MKLSDAERVILHRLHELLAAVKPKEAREHRLAMEILERGYHESFYGDETGPHLSKVLPHDQMKFVYDVLDLFTALGRSYKALPKAEKAAIDKAKIKFAGFDGNNENDLMAFVRFLIKDQGRWSDLDDGGDFNSHCPMVDIYKRMLGAKPKGPLRDYTAAEISAMFEAKVHPSMRGKK